MTGRSWRGIAAAALAAGMVFGIAGPTSAAYHLLNKAVLGGDGSWDMLTVDPDAHRLYISRSSHVMVVDVDSLKVVGDIPGTPGVHGIAIVRELGRGFASNGGDTSVTMFDLATLKPLDRIRVGMRPDAIVYDPATRRVFTMNAGSSDATAIDAATGKVVGTVPLAGKPEFAVPDGKGRMFVNAEDSSVVRVVDTKELRVVGTYPLAPGEEPSGLALDKADGVLFAGCGNLKMMAVDAGSGKVVAEIPIGKGVDANEFDPGTNRAFSSNGDGTLTVASKDKDGKWGVAESVTTEPGARTMALDPKTHRVYLVTAQFGTAPAPTADRPHPRRPILPNTFEVLVYGD